MTVPRFAQIATLALSLLAVPAPAQIITVGVPGSGAMFSEIQPAIDSASPGSTILLGAGGFKPFVLDKSVNILGSGSLTTTVIANTPDTSAVSILDIRFDEHVVLAGFRAVGGVSTCVSPWGPAPCTPFIDVNNCQGSVVLEDLLAVEIVTNLARGAGLRIQNSDQVQVLGCEMRGSTWASTTGSAPGVDVFASQVSFVGSTARGGDGGSAVVLGSAPGAPGALFVDSNIEFVRSSAFGGSGGIVTDIHGGLLGAGQGLPGIQANNSSLLLAGGSATKIVAGFTLCNSSSPCGANGGPALLLLLNSTVEATTGVDFVPGPAPCSPQPGCTFNQPGPTFDSDGTQTFTTTATIFPSLTGPAAGLPLGGASAVTVYGEPNAPVTIFWSPNLVAPLTLPVVGGLAVLDTTSLGTLGSLQLDAGGTGSLPVAIPTSPSFLGLTAHMQALQFGTYLGLSSPWLIYVN